MLCYVIMNQVNYNNKHFLPKAAIRVVCVYAAYRKDSNTVHNTGQDFQLAFHLTICSEETSRELPSLEYEIHTAMQYHLTMENE